MNIVLFGAPGAGKGTQSQLLVEKLDMFQISTGDLFRAAIKNRTALGLEAQGYMDKGSLVPDSVVIGMVSEVLNSIGNKKFILDGFPRTVSQANALGDILVAKGIEVSKAIFLEVPREELLKRLTGRRVCRSCGAVYHIYSKPSKTAGVCDLCGSEVIQRVDDKEDVIVARLKAYEESTYPLKSFYKELGRYCEVNGNQDASAVFDEIRRQVQ